MNFLVQQVLFYNIRTVDNFFISLLSGPVVLVRLLLVHHAQKPCRRQSSQFNDEMLRIRLSSVFKLCITFLTIIHFYNLDTNSEQINSSSNPTEYNLSFDFLGYSVRQKKIIKHCVLVCSLYINLKLMKVIMYSYNYLDRECVAAFVYSAQVSSYLNKF